MTGRGTLRQRGTLGSAPGAIPVGAAPVNPVPGQLWVDPTADPNAAYPTKRNRALASLGDSIGCNGAFPQMAVASLSAPANSGDTTVTVTGIGAPGVIGDFVVAGADAAVKIGSEYCRVTAASGSTLTLAAPGLAGAHVAGESVVSIPTVFNNGAPTPALAAAIASKGQLVHGGTYGHSSASVTQLTTTYLPLVIAAQPGYCYVMAGRNDLGDGLPATTIAAAARVVAIWDALLAAGTLPIASTLPPIPSGSTAAYLKQNQEFNTIIVVEAAKRGLPVTDLYALMVDPSTGNFLAAYLNDGIHPNSNGRWVQGVDIWTTLSLSGLAHVEPGLPVTQAYPDSSVYILGHSAANAIFSTGGGGNFGGGTSNPPSGWNTSVADSIAKVTLGAVTGWAGQGMTFTKTANANGSGQVQTASNASLTAGHRYRIKCRIKTSGVAAARTADSGFVGWSLFFAHQGFSMTRTIFMLDQIYQDITDGVLTVDFVAPMQPTSPTGLAILLQVIGTATTPSYTVTIGQITVEDLTALGASSVWPL